mgnify:CR=1 FL=1
MTDLPRAQLRTGAPGEWQREAACGAEAQLQVYLYVLRMINANLPFSVEDIVNKFQHSEKEVLRALKYWELQKLLSLDFDENKNLVGIHLECIQATGY